MGVGIMLFDVTTGAFYVTEVPRRDPRPGQRIDGDDQPGRQGARRAGRRRTRPRRTASGRRSGSPLSVPPRRCSGPSSRRCATTESRTDRPRVPRYRRATCTGASGGTPRAAVWLTLAALTAVLGPAPPASAAPHGPSHASEVALRQARTYALHQLARTDRRLGPGRYPTVAVGDGMWRTERHQRLAGRLLAGPALARLRARPAAGPGPAGPPSRRHRSPCGQDDTSAHDLGFLLQTSFGAGADLRRPPQRRRRVRLRAAAALATRFVPSAGRAPQLGRADRPDHRHRRQPDEPPAALLGGRPRRSAAVARRRRPARAHRGALAGAARREHLPRRPVRRADRSAGWSGTAQGLPTGRRGRAASPGRCTASPRRTTSRATRGCWTQPAGRPPSP